MITSWALHERVARRIRELARARGMTLARLAERAGVSRSHLGEVLACAASPRVAWLAKVAHGLGVVPAALVEEARRRPARRARAR